MNAPLLFDWRRDEARRASRRRQQARQRAQERQRRMDAIIALAAVIGLLLALGVGLASTPQHVAHADTAVTGDAAYTVEDFTDMSDLAWRNGNQCESRFDWPVDDPQVEQQFERPINPWAPGHRGVDLVAEQGTVILSPQAGTVKFCWQSSWQRCGECTASWRCHVDIRTGRYRALSGGYDLPQTARRHR